MGAGQDRRSRGRFERPVGALRWLIGVFLAVVAGGAGFIAWGALSKLWGDYQDSPAITYVLFGGSFALLSIASLVALARLLGWGQGRRGRG